jgi:hypothetical protein
LRERFVPFGQPIQTFVDAHCLLKIT